MAIRLFYDITPELTCDLPMGLEFLFLFNPKFSHGEYIDLNLPSTLNHLYIMKTNFLKFAEYKVPYDCKVTYMEALSFQDMNAEGRILKKDLRKIFTEKKIFDFYSEEEFTEFRSKEKFLNLFNNEP